jgi:tetratricopeptide (TPR) repeat protein
MIFISYARTTSTRQAEALHRELGRESFFDTSNIEDGERFDKRLIEALLDASVVVIFADETYFTRWYCLRELRTALAPYDVAFRRAGTTREQLEEALQHIVIAVAQPSALAHLPTPLKTTKWPHASDTKHIAELARARAHREPLRKQLASPEATRIRETLLEEAALPPPANLAGVPCHLPGAMEQSIHERFVGRANDLARIHFTLSTMRGDPAQAAALSGRISAAGGFGKTRIAAEYLHRYGPAYYPGGLFWIDADRDESGLEEQFHGVLRTLVPSVKDLPTLRSKKLRVRDLLAQAVRQRTKDQPLLFVVDNVPESDSPVRLGEFCPVIGISTVLATSRQEILEDGVRRLPLRELPSNASVLLLIHELDNADELSTREWGLIAERVGYLPLALHLLNRVLQSKAARPCDLLYQSSRTETLDKYSKALKGQVPEGALRGITEAFSTSYEKLDSATGAAACLLAQLGPTPIPEEIVEAFGQTVNTLEIRLTLTGRGFITGGAQGAFGSMHRVIADFLRSAAGSRAKEQFVATCEAVLKVMEPDRCQNPKDWPLMNACRPHAEWLFERSLAIQDRDVSNVGSELGVRAALLLSAQGDFASAQRLNETALEATQQMFGDEHPITLTSMHNLAFTLLSRDHLDEARRLQEQVLEVRRRVLGEEHLSTLHAMINLASTLLTQGHLDDARRLQERVLELGRRVLGEAHPDTVLAMNNLAGTLWTQGDLDGARALAEEALGARRRALGEEHPRTLTCMDNLAEILRSQGDLDGARQLREKVLEMTRRVLGEAHPDTLLVMKGMASILRQQGHSERAQSLEDEAEEIRRRKEQRR